MKTALQKRGLIQEPDTFNGLVTEQESFWTLMTIKAIAVTEQFSGLAHSKPANLPRFQF